MVICAASNSSFERKAHHDFEFVDNTRDTKLNLENSKTYLSMILSIMLYQYTSILNTYRLLVLST